MNMNYILLSLCFLLFFVLSVRRLKIEFRDAVPDLEEQREIMQNYTSWERFLQRHVSSFVKKVFLVQYYLNFISFICLLILAIVFDSLQMGERQNILVAVHFHLNTFFLIVVELLNPPRKKEQ